MYKYYTFSPSNLQPFQLFTEQLFTEQLQVPVPVNSHGYRSLGRRGRLLAGRK